MGGIFIKRRLGTGQPRTINPAGGLHFRFARTCQYPFGELAIFDSTASGVKNTLGGHIEPAQRLPRRHGRPNKRQCRPTRLSCPADYRLGYSFVRRSGCRGYRAVRQRQGDILPGAPRSLRRFARPRYVQSVFPPPGSRSVQDCGPAIHDRIILNLSRCCRDQEKDAAPSSGHRQIQIPVAHGQRLGLRTTGWTWGTSLPTTVPMAHPPLPPGGASLAVANFTKWRSAHPMPAVDRPRNTLMAQAAKSSTRCLGHSGLKRGRHQARVGDGRYTSIPNSRSAAPDAPDRR